MPRPLACDWLAAQARRSVWLCIKGREQEESQRAALGFYRPGVLTRTLLNCGAHRVVALESDKSFLPELQELEGKLDGQLQVIHCDFFKLDPIGQGSMKPPAMFSEKLFSDLGISEVPWTADVLVKVVGIFSQRNERNMLWKLIYALYERLSVFRYGRVELIMFISERDSWSAGSGTDVLLRMGLFEDVMTGQISPSEYKRLFELMDKSEEFTQSWLYDEILENTKNTGCG
ncbi:hypothetical protein PDJAM_G00022000 [Pangasius djambal]|uniref:Uncharacterized protein n=1 Tax=Pangasius djambal TaxID=1691987 RepID=A0ACC5YNT7_9TELE|nr:hypothetical protein [Pangasius djambal]